MKLQVKTLVHNSLKEFFRSPLVLLLLFALPFYFIIIIYSASPNVRVPMQIGGRIVFYDLASFFALITVAFVVAVVSGVIGLFLMNRTKIDARLIVSGHSKINVLVAKLAVSFIFLVFVTTIALGVVRIHTSPEVWSYYILGILLSGSIYSMVGVFVGVFANRMGGVYTIISLPLVDLLMFQNPLVASGALESWVELLPGFHPMQIVVRASTGLRIPSRIFLKSFLYLFVVACLASLSIYWSLRAK